MKFHAVQGGSEQWHALRLGKPTCSRFDAIMKRSPNWRVVNSATGEQITNHTMPRTANDKVVAQGKKGVLCHAEKYWPESEGSTRYRNELIAERMLGASLHDFQSQAMLRGQHLEPEAISFYEMHRDRTTDDGGFIEQEGWGGSPDRLVYTVGQNDWTQPETGLEVKCPGPAVHIGYLLDPESFEKQYRHQVQGYMLLLGVPYWDMLSYHPGLPPVLRRVAAEPEWQEAFQELLFAFIYEVDAAVVTLKERGVKFAE